MSEGGFPLRRLPNAVAYGEHWVDHTTAVLHLHQHWHEAQLVGSKNWSELQTRYDRIMGFCRHTSSVIQLQAERSLFAENVDAS